MEIQTFFLAHEIKRLKDSNNHNGKMVGIHTINLEDDVYPLLFSPHMFLQLRRQVVDFEETCKIHMRITDSDGKSIFKLSPETIDLTFPRGNKFATITGVININLPRAGDYFIELALLTLPGTTQYIYQFQVLPPSSSIKGPKIQAKRRRPK